jgi:hypothetical protein
VDGLCGLRRLQRLPRQALRLGKVKQLTVEEVAGAKRGVPGIQNSYIYITHTHTYIYIWGYMGIIIRYIWFYLYLYLYLYIYIYLYLYLYL